MSIVAGAIIAASSVDIRRPHRDVFTYLCNLEHFPSWFPGVASMRSQDELGHGRIGKRYRELLALPFGRSALIDIEVKEVVPGERMVTEGSGLVLPRMTMQLRALAGGTTRLEWTMHSLNRGRWFRWLALPLLRRVMQARAHVGLRRLSQILESEGAPPAGMDDARESAAQRSR